MVTDINQSKNKGKILNQQKPIARIYNGIRNKNDFLKPLINSKFCTGIIKEIFLKYVFCLSVYFKKGIIYKKAIKIGKQNQFDVNKLNIVKGNVKIKYSEKISK